VRGWESRPQCRCRRGVLRLRLWRADRLQRALCIRAAHSRHPSPRWRSIVGSGPLTSLLRRRCSPRRALNGSYLGARAVASPIVLSSPRLVGRTSGEESKYGPRSKSEGLSAASARRHPKCGEAEVGSEPQRLRKGGGGVANPPTRRVRATPSRSGIASSCVHPLSVAGRQTRG
jgi:hypothetical protein